MQTSLSSHRTKKLENKATKMALIVLINRSREVIKPIFRVSDLDDTNWHDIVQSQKIARSLKFWIKVEEQYYPSGKNKDTDQLFSYCTADLCLCFRIGKNPVFS